VLTTPKGATGKKKAKLLYSANPLDQTMIHPSSYELAERFVVLLGRCYFVDFEIAVIV